ncbi:MAG: sugar nucleotide-binding protein, partial [Acidimicrobiales bacterium]
GASAVAGVCARHGARLVHVSSDIVHGGDLAADATGYADDAEPSPINPYGRSKAVGERLVLDALPAAAVVRTSLIYGIERVDRGTAGFIERLERGERLSLWGDAIRQPVWIDALSSALLDLALVHTNVTGTLNVAGDEAMSRADFARRLLAHWGVDASGRIDITRAADLEGQPLDLRLDLRLARTLGLPVPGVGEVLADTWSAQKVVGWAIIDTTRSWPRAGR